MPMKEPGKRDIAVRISRWALVLLLLVAAVIGAAGMLVSIVGNHYTSTEAFCSTSCHSMTFVAADLYFQKSAHRSNNEGMRPGCAACHIPTTNWFIETYTHATSGIRDLYVEMTHDFSTQKLWDARRVQLEQEVRATMRAQDSVTCRSCHDASAIHPKSDAGKQSHAMLSQGGVTCIDCHTNLVHPPASPSQADASPAGGSK